MKRAATLMGAALLPVGWLFAGVHGGMVGHMAGHMIAVAVAAPALAYGLSGGAYDPARRWPRIVTPMAMMLVELVTVWAWHLPALRAAADGALPALMIEQLSFAAAGLLLWASVLHAPQRASGIGALLLTSMHMTLLGVLVGLAPRPLYGRHAMTGTDPMIDQQLGGVVMLMVGAASYFLGGLALLLTLIRERATR